MSLLETSLTFLTSTWKWLSLSEVRWHCWEIFILYYLILIWLYIYIYIYIYISFYYWRGKIKSMLLLKASMYSIEALTQTDLRFVDLLILLFWYVSWLVKSTAAKGFVIVSKCFFYLEDIHICDICLCNQ